LKADFFSPVRILVLSFFLYSTFSQAQLVINEVSQGPSGSKEWVELLVVGNPSCDSTCVDLRGWIIDDNNGTFASGSGTGIADGHMRFSNDPQWACVGFGAMIVIYNETDPDPALPNDDITDSNGDCIYILPGSSNLFEKDISIPSVIGTSSYSAANYTNGGLWTTVQMNNSTDSYQTISPNDINQPYFAVSWGGNSSNNVIYFSGAAGGNTIYMSNAIDDDPFNQNNWMRSSSGTDQTPGAPNNAANATWISTLNNNCSPFTPPSVVIFENDTNVCTGSPVELTAITNTSSTPVFNWNTGQTGSPITVTTDKDSTFIVTANVSGCTLTDSVRITIGGQVVFDLGNDTAICAGSSVELTAPISGTYLWSTNETSASISVQPQSTQTYALEITDGNCVGTDSIEITVDTPPVITISNDTSICEGNSVVLFVNGGSTYSWSTGENTSSINVSPIVTSNYSVTAGSGACSSTEGVLVSVVPNNLSANINVADVSCSGANDGVIELQGIQGNPSLITLLDDQGSTLQLGQDSVFENLDAGVYSILLSNTNDCSIDINGVEIDENTVQFSYDITQPDCDGQNGSIEIITESVNTVSLNGSTFDTDYSFENLSGGNYTLEVMDSTGCVVNETFILETPTPIQLDILADSLRGMIGESSSFEIELNGGQVPLNWIWTSGFDLSCYDCTNPSLTFENTGWLNLFVDDENNCFAQDSLFIQVEESLNFGIPNAFTPNSDGSNDTYYVVANGELRNFKMKIFNRWGQKIYETNDNSLGWDGTYKGELQMPGTYVYQIRFDEYSNGIWKQRVEVGSLTLLR
jgi:gliding motility-associated-like protein